MKNITYKHLMCHLLAIIMIGLSLHLHSAETNKGIINALVDNESEDGFLPPDVAFKLDLTARDARSLEAAFKVVPGYYLYRERVKFEVAANSNHKIISVDLPAGEIKDDPNFGKQEVYHHDFQAIIKLTDTSDKNVIINATYQGCSEKGLCYAPIKKTFNLKLGASSTQSSVSDSGIADSNDDSTSLLKTGNLWLIVAGFFGAGLLLSLTPCVLPMIPILSSIIVGSQSNNTPNSKTHSFSLSVAYVLGMAFSYTLAGIAAGLSGNLLSQSLQNPMVLGASALVFVALALSMFGFYELKLPAFIENRILSASNQLKGGQLFGVFVMGLLSALIVSPCIAAPLAGALIYISQSQDVFLGGIALFALSIGMGVPLLLIGASAGQLLPKAGGWMTSVRNFFGVLMLGMAIWLIAPVILVSIQLGMWATLFIVIAVHLKALDNLPEHASSFAKFCKGIAVILLISGVTFLLGAVSGGKSVLQPLSGFTRAAFTGNGLGPTNAAKTESTLAFTRIKTNAELGHYLSTSKKPVMLDFYADWCVACKEYEKFTFSDPTVKQLLKNTTLLQVDVTANSDEDKALMKRFMLFGPPGIIFFDQKGQEITAMKTVGYQNPKRFIRTLNELNSQK